MPNVYDEDPYKILGIPPTATAEDVKQAYHKLARENHPDLNKDARAAERMKEINWANEILSDPQKRAAYDQWKASAFQSTDFTGPYTYRGYTRPSQPYTTYQTGPTVRKVRTVGCSAGPLIWILATIVLSALRGIRPLAQSNFNYSVEDPATQAIMMEQLDTALETLHATETFPYETLQPLDLVLSTPSPVLTFPTEDPSVQDLRSQAVPGSWIWNQLALHFPELTTTTGLSDEVIQVIYDELGTYKIKTRSLGEYWLVTDSSNEVVVPIHFPLSLSATPSP